MRKFIAFIQSLFGNDADAMKNQILHLHIEHKKAQKVVDNHRLKLSRVKEQKLNHLGALKQKTLSKTSQCIDKMNCKAIAEEAEIDQKYTEAKNKIAEKKSTAASLKQKADDLNEVSLSVE
jgi:hypothetical protein